MVKDEFKHVEHKVEMPSSTLNKFIEDSAKLDEAKKVITKFFDTPANINSFTDYEECYMVLGELRKILVGVER